MSLEKYLGITSYAEDAKMAVNAMIPLVEYNERDSWRRVVELLESTQRDCEVKIKSLLDDKQEPQDRAVEPAAPAAAAAMVAGGPPANDIPVAAEIPPRMAAEIPPTAAEIPPTAAEIPPTAAEIPPPVAAEIPPPVQIHPTFTNEPDRTVDPPKEAAPVDPPKEAAPVDPPKEAAPVDPPKEAAPADPTIAPDVAQRIDVAQHIDAALDRFFMALSAPNATWDNTRVVLQNSLVPHARVSISTDRDITIVQLDATDCMMLSGSAYDQYNIHVKHNDNEVVLLVGTTEVRFTRTEAGALVARYKNGTLMNSINAPLV